MTPLVLTLDLEDHRPDRSRSPRYRAVTASLLDDLDRWRVKATVFVVGDLVDESPDLIREIAHRGHEIGLHGATHDPLPEVGPARFEDATRAARSRLSEVAGTEIRGYRAPIFSLVPDAVWAPAILTRVGFTYSSSVLPAHNPLYGWPGTPREPFRWETGLIELPCPVFGFGRLTVPLLGGTYLRLAPRLLGRWAARRVAGRADGWVYAHPYDFDPDEPRWVVPEVGRTGSRLLWWNRRRMRSRVKALVEGSGRTLGAVVDDLDDPPVFAAAVKSP